MIIASYQRTFLQSIQNKKSICLFENLHTQDNNTAALSIIKYSPAGHQLLIPNKQHCTSMFIPLKTIFEPFFSYSGFEKTVTVIEQEKEYIAFTDESWLESSLQSVIDLLTE